MSIAQDRFEEIQRLAACQAADLENAQKENAKLEKENADLRASQPSKVLDDLRPILCSACPGESRIIEAPKPKAIESQCIGNVYDLPPQPVMKTF
jgi:hypothetical protein